MLENLTKKMKRNLQKQELIKKITNLENEIIEKKPKPKTNYEKTMGLKEEYEEIKERLVKAEAKMNNFKKKAKKELEWILSDGE